MSATHDELAADAVVSPGPDGHGQQFCPENGFMSAAGMHDMATVMVLRMVLRPLAIVMFLGSAAMLARDVLGASGQVSAASLVVVFVITGATAVLWSGAELSSTALRAVELGLFGGVAWQLLLAQHRMLAAAATRGDPGLVMAAFNGGALAFLLLTVAYAVFVPNPWWRAAIVVLPLALAPVVLVLVMRARHPELVAMATGAFTAGKILEIGLLLALGAMLSVMGSALITRFRSASVDAREANMYKLGDRIGAGGMGEVWQAEHQMLARPAAVKVIRPEIVASGDRQAAALAIRRFEREARATAALRSPHTVEIYDFGVTFDGTFYYVMEYLDGLNFETLINRHGPLSPARAISLLCQVCASLADAHANGMIHRDIKPANIFACRLGQEHDFVKVLDFGLVKRDRPAEDTESRLTVDGLTTGTPAFMAPELALHDNPIGPGTDVYALGCVAYWLVTGKPVFAQDTPMAMVVDHVRTVPVAPSERTETEIPAPLDEVILKCLAKNPAERYASMIDLSAALQEVPLGDGEWNARQAREWWDLHYPEASDQQLRAS